MHRKQLLLKLSPILLIVLVLIVGPLQSIEARIDPGSGSTPPAFYLIPNITRVEDRSAIAATGVDILEVGPDYVLVRASADEATQLRLKGYTLDNDPATLQRFALDTFPPADSGYHDYGEMVAEIQQAATDHPDILKLIDIGSSYEGRTIWLAKISSDVNLDENKPEVLFVHHQHAREHLTVEQGLYTLHLLLDNYGSDAQITQLVNSRVIWIIFDANPDGGEYDISGGTYYYWRKNRQPTSITGTLGIDLNRNWGYNWGCCFGSSPEPSSDIYRGSAAFSAPETQVIRDFVNSRYISGTQRIKIAIDFHSYSELILWPYGYTYTPVPPDMTQRDHDIMVTMGTAMAAMNGYTPEQASGLYLTDGTIDDWLYGTYHMINFTFEMYPTSSLQGGFYPPDGVIAAQTARNRDPILYAIDLADDPGRVIVQHTLYIPLVVR